MPSRTIVIVGEDDRDRLRRRVVGHLRRALRAAPYRRAAFLAGAISVAGDIEVLPAALASKCVASGADLTLAASRAGL